MFSRDRGIYQKGRRPHCCLSAMSYAFLLPMIWINIKGASVYEFIDESWGGDFH